MTKRFPALLTVCAVTCVAALVAAGCGGSSSDDGSSTAAGEITVWHGYGELAAPGEEPNVELDSFKRLVGEFEASHPDIKVKLSYVNSDFSLQKLTVALQGGKAPDVTYQYGTNMAQLATTPKVVDLTDRVGDAAYDWNDVFPGIRDVFTVDGKVMGVPALVDNLAVVYNKTMFAAAGIPEPTPDWTWDDLSAAAVKLTDPATKEFGLEFPIDGSESEVWKFVAMLWEAGGDILSEDGKTAAFASPQGVRALATLEKLATAKAVYLNAAPDSPKAGQLFNAGKLGMFITGPWDLSSFPDADYGVQVMPSFDAGGGHDTIAGPDAWVLIDNGPDRVDAAWTFLSWLTAKKQVLADSLATGHLPTRASVEAMPDFSGFAKSFPGIDVFATNLENVKKARPVTTTYPQVSQFLGNAVTSVLLGKATSQAALDDAATQANGVIAG
jgi:multiple sugar transport system substrate-binding protein